MLSFEEARVEKVRGIGLAASSRSIDVAVEDEDGEIVSIDRLRFNPIVSVETSEVRTCHAGDASSKGFRSCKLYNPYVVEMRWRRLEADALSGREGLCASLTDWIGQQ